MTPDTAYANLSPGSVLDAIDSLGLRCDGTLLQLNSFENRVFQIRLEDGSLRIAKFYRPGRWSDAAIGEEHAFTLELAAQDSPVVPPLVINGHTLHHAAGHRFALFSRQGGRTPEIEQEQTLEWLGRFLGRLHAVGARTAYQVRPALDIETFGVAQRQLLLAGGWLPEDLRAAWSGITDAALNAVRAAYARAGRVRLLRLHGDCHPGNLLWTEDGPHLVDFDDSRSGPAIQDLWMLLSGDAPDMRRQFAALLRGYTLFHPFDAREIHLVEALRTLRLI
ncbi:MAG: serine/threonine protein kinase, partial [Burkholderiaceae bacterium]|nr:serine/threonine protein kinase [Burkholderiaceae bacterium]